MAKIYRVFLTGYEFDFDFSDDSLIEMYNSESYGTPVSKNNGFYVGKKTLNITVKMWKEDIKIGNLFIKELYDDGKFPHWWLDSVLKEFL